VSDAYQQFIRQYNATGREKADGYARAHFDGMTPAEKAQAFDLLKDEVARHPSFVEWLFYVDAARAAPVALQIVQQQEVDPYYPAYLVYEQLQAHSQDLRYQQRMIDGYPRVPADYRDQAIEALGRTPPSPARRDFLRDVLLSETNPSVLAGAAYHLVVDLKLPYNTDAEKKRFRQVVAALGSEDATQRQATLRSLGL
jgi:hypothetical protein